MIYLMTLPKRINLSFCLYHVLYRTNSGETAFTYRRDENKNVMRKKEEEERKTEKILNQVTAHFQMDKELIQRARHGKGDLGKARTVLIYLLREYLPWMGKRIIGIAGLRSWGVLSYHTTKEKINALRETIDILQKELKDI